MRKWAIVLSLFMVAFALLLPKAAIAEESVSTKAKIVYGVSFRDEPSTSGDVIRYLKKDEVVTVRSMVNQYWYKIQDAEGDTGYVSTSSKYITITSNAKIIYGVNLRTQPATSGSSVIRMLSKGEEILVLEKVNDGWYKVKDSKGNTGYISSGSKYIVTNFSVYMPVLPLEDQVDAVISAGKDYLGTPYEFGSERWDSDTFDCSDFVQTAFWDALKIVLPSDSNAQGDYVKELGSIHTNWKNLDRGDLMFFSEYKGSKSSDYDDIDISDEPITHVGIYLGDGKILHTYSSESGGVRIDTIEDSQWENRFMFGGSALE